MILSLLPVLQSDSTEFVTGQNVRVDKKLLETYNAIVGDTDELCVLELTFPAVEMFITKPASKMYIEVLRNEHGGLLIGLVAERKSTDHVRSNDIRSVIDIMYSYGISVTANHPKFVEPTSISVYSV